MRGWSVILSGASIKTMDMASWTASSPSLANDGFAHGRFQPTSMTEAEVLYLITKYLKAYPYLVPYAAGIENQLVSLTYINYYF